MSNDRDAVVAQLRAAGLHESAWLLEQGHDPDALALRLGLGSDVAPCVASLRALATAPKQDAAEDAVRRDDPVRVEEPALREQVIAALDLLNRVRLQVGAEVGPPTDGLYGSGHAAVGTARRRAQRASTIEGLLHDGLNEVLLCDLARAIRAGVLVPEERS